MNQVKQLALGKVLIISSVLVIGAIIMGYGVYMFAIDTSWKPQSGTQMPGRTIPGLGLFEINLHNDYWGLIPGSSLIGNIRVDIAVPNSTKVQITFPEGLVPGDSNHTSGLAPANKIPLNFTTRSTLETNAFETPISGLVYYHPGDFNAILTITKNNTAYDYHIDNILNIQPYSNYESQRIQNISIGILYFTAGLVCISISPVLIQLHQYVYELRKKSMWENWIKENNLNYDKTEICFLKRKLKYFLPGLAIGVSIYFGLWIGGHLTSNVPVTQFLLSATFAIGSSFAYVGVLILLIFSTIVPIFVKRVKDIDSRGIYLALAGVGTALPVCELVLIIMDVCNIPLFAHLSKCLTH